MNKTQSTSSALTAGQIRASKDAVTFTAEVESEVVLCLLCKSGGAGAAVLIENLTDGLIFQAAKRLERVSGKPACEIVAKLVGGSHPVGERTLHAVKQQLQTLNLVIVGENTGGNFKRQTIFHPQTGRLQVAKTVADGPTPLAPTAISRGSSKPSALSWTPAPPAKGSKARVLIVDDSKTIRDLLERILKNDPDLEVVGMAENPIQAQELLPLLRPNVITLDVFMPEMTGVEWIEKLLPETPIPVVMISSLQMQDGNEVFRALELGAIDYIQKPTLSELADLAPLIREKIKAAVHAKVMVKSRHAPSPPVFRSSAPVQFDPDIIIALGASTGGTEAIREVLTRLPANIPPMVIVQHIPPIFSKAFAERMNDACPFEVREAKNGDELKSGLVLIAPGATQMRVEKGPHGHFVRINDDPPVNRHKPSVDYLFDSVAARLGANCVAVILTGMGADGAKGMLRLHQAGARTLAQDQESSVVYGMPRVAFELGGVSEVHSLDNMAAALIRACQKRRAA